MEGGEGGEGREREGRIQLLEESRSFESGGDGISDEETNDKGSEDRANDDQCYFPPCQILN